MKHIDLTGQRYGKLVVLSQLPKEGKYYIYLCKCDCGNTIEVKAEEYWRKSMERIRNELSQQKGLQAHQVGASATHAVLNRGQHTVVMIEYN